MRHSRRGILALHGGEHVKFTTITCAQTTRERCPQQKPHDGVGGMQQRHRRMREDDRGRLFRHVVTVSPSAARSCPSRSAIASGTSRRTPVANT